MMLQSRLLFLAALFLSGSLLAAPPPDLASLLARGDGAGYKAALDGWLTAQDKSVVALDAASRWNKLCQTPGYLHALAQEELFRVTGAQGMAQVLA